MDTPVTAMDATWLVQLEERVERAVAEMGRLRQENRRLEREILRLKKTGAATADGSAAWEREKAEVKGRVERLARRLEELLGEGAVALLETDGGPRPPVQRTLEPID